MCEWILRIVDGLFVFSFKLGEFIQKSILHVLQLFLYVCLHFTKFLNFGLGGSNFRPSTILYIKSIIFPSLLSSFNYFLNWTWIMCLTQAALIALYLYFARFGTFFFSVGWGFCLCTMIWFVTGWCLLVLSILLLLTFISIQWLVLYFLFVFFRFVFDWNCFGWWLWVNCKIFKACFIWFLFHNWPYWLMNLFFILLRL